MNRKIKNLWFNGKAVLNHLKNEVSVILERQVVIY